MFGGQRSLVGVSFLYHSLGVPGIRLRSSGLHGKPSCWLSIFIRWLVSILSGLVQELGHEESHVHLHSFIGLHALVKH